MATIYNWSSTASENDDAGTPINWAENQLPSTVNNSARELMKQVADWRTLLSGAKISATADTMTLTSGLSLSAYAQGTMFAFEAGAANTTAVTLNVDGLGAKAVVKNYNVALVAGDLIAGGLYIVAYEATAGNFQLLSPTGFPAGFGIANSPQFTGIELGHATDTTITRQSSGNVNIEGNIIYRAGGTDVPVADGGTGASTLTDGGVLLGSGTGAITAMAVLANGEMIVGDGTTDPVAESGATLRTSIGLGTGNNVQFTNGVFTGNLDVQGTTTTIDTDNLVVADNLIELNHGVTSSTNDAGVVIERGSTGNNAIVAWDESADGWIVGTTTATGGSTGNLTIAAAPFNCAALTATTITGATSLALASGATVTGINDTDAFSDASATTLATSESIKAYSDSTTKAAGLQMTFETATGDSNQGSGKIWANNSTLANVTILYISDTTNDSTNINAFVDSFATPTASNSAVIYIQEAGVGTAGVVFQVSGAVVSASGYSKVTVTHQATFGTLADADVIGVTIAFSGNNGSMTELSDDTSPQLGGDLDAAGNQIQWSKGADVASNSTLSVGTDGNYFDVTGTTGITAIGTTGGPGTLIKLHFDGACVITHQATNLILAGAENFTTEAGDELEFVEYDTGKYRQTGWCLAGTAPGGGGGGAFLGEGASGSSVGNSGDIIRVNENTLNTSQTMVATDNGSATGPISIASGVTLTISSGATFVVI